MDTTLRCIKIFRFQVTFCSLARTHSKISVSFTSPKILELSRRDDLISLLYMLVYIVSGKVHWLGTLRNQDPGYFRKVGSIKKKLGSEELCIGDALPLKEFSCEVLGLKFADKPDYAKLKHLLTKILLN